MRCHVSSAISDPSSASIPELNETQEALLLYDYHTYLRDTFEYVTEAVPPALERFVGFLESEPVIAEAMHRVLNQCEWSAARIEETQRQVCVLMNRYEQEGLDEHEMRHMIVMILKQVERTKLIHACFQLIVSTANQSMQLMFLQALSQALED